MRRQSADVVGSKASARILSAARRLFATRGFAATTTRDIARLAGLNEALVFYYFRSKRNLYWAVLEQTRRGSHFVESLRKRLNANHDGDAAIEEVFEFIVQSQEDDDTLFRLLLFTGLQHGKDFEALSGRFFKIHLRMSYDLVAEYVRRQIRTGRFRKIDPMIASRAMFSLATYHHVIQEFLGGKYARQYSAKQVGRDLAKFWLGAMATDGKNKLGCRAKR